MSSFLEKRLAANKLLLETEENEIMPVIQLRDENDPADLLAKMQAALGREKRDDIEEIPRQTLVKMFTTTPLEVKFVFKTVLGGGSNYVQAMRQVLSRVRNKAAASKMELEDFKLFELGVESKEDHDEVTLIRSATMTQKEESVYRELMQKISIKLEPRK